ncbi:hypothetical protein ACQEVF_53470 [Nonomuraea polychroma]|uniref:hypothetical protein n=1 Tax=Nonomuraea polychroma TaxID=46176 RepID=UPI003D92E1BD
MDSTTARAHHHAAGMVLDGELVQVLEEAAEQERGLSQRGKTPKTADPAKTGTGMRAEAGGYGCGAGSG